MDIETFASLSLFAIATLFTPGPNNIMLASSGVHFGFYRTLPHMAGTSLGFGLMLFCICLGLGEIFLRYSLVKEIMQWIALCILLFVAWKTATSHLISQAKKEVKPYRFLPIVLFQWVNPKAWVMAIGASSAFMQGESSPFLEGALVAGTFTFFGTFSAATWIFIGLSLQNFLKIGRRLAYFNYCMALLIVLSCLSLLD